MGNHPETRSHHYPNGTKYQLANRWSGRQAEPLNFGALERRFRDHPRASPASLVGSIRDASCVGGEKMKQRIPARHLSIGRKKFDIQSYRIWKNFAVTSPLSRIAGHPSPTQRVHRSAWQMKNELRLFLLGRNEQTIRWTLTPIQPAALLVLPVFL